MLRPANLLLLDEPTNHLDVEAREALETFLRDAPATVLVVSHDRRLLENLCGRLWVVDDGAVAPFEGGYRAWREAVADGWTVAAALAKPTPAARTATARTRPPATSPVPSSPATTRPPPRRRTRLSKDAYRRRSAEVEGELNRLGLRRNHLELALGDPAVQGNFVEMRRVTSELADVSAALAAAEDAWLELQEQAP
jgi:ATP-binding cassette subfamily F protein 3